MLDDAIEVTRIERVRLRSLVERQMDVADSLHADDYQLVTPSGSTLSKHEYLGRVASKSLEYVVFEPESEIRARSSEGLVVLRYVARIVLAIGVDERDEFQAWHTDVYEKRRGEWLAVWSQATTIH